MTIKNNHIKELNLSFEQAKQMFGFTKEDLNPKHYPNFGIPLPETIVHKLYNVLVINQGIEKTDLNSFVYYFCGYDEEPPNIKKITWLSTMDVLRTLLFDIFDPYIKAGCIKQTEIVKIAQEIFIYKNKKPKLYNKSSKLTEKANVLENFIEPLCKEITCSFQIGYFKNVKLGQ